MARRKLQMLAVKEILYQLANHKSRRAIARSLGVSRNTVDKIVRQATDLTFDVSKGESEVERIAAPLCEIRQTPKVIAAPIKDTLKAYHEQIEEWRSTPNMTYTQMTRLLKEEGMTVSESSLRRYVQAHFLCTVAPPTTMHWESAPGDQAQVDFGYAGPMIDPVTKGLRRAHAFIMTLSYSRYRFVRFVFRQDVQTWNDCHTRAFEFFGGVPQTVVLDNLKAGVVKPHIYDPTLNRAYAELERHYGFVADPAKVRKPEHKGKVERSVTIVRQQVLAGRTFQDSEAANAYALHWCRHEIAQRVTRTTGETPFERFEAQEKACLKPLPPVPYEHAIWQKVKVNRDQHIVVCGSFYSLPVQYVDQEVWVKATQRLVEIFLHERKIRTHLKATRKGQWVTDIHDYPAHKRHFLYLTSQSCIITAAKIGKETQRVVERVLERSGLTSRRKAQAILRLAESYSPEQLETACANALLFERTDYATLKKLTEDGIDYTQIPVPKILGPESLYARSCATACEGESL